MKIKTILLILFLLNSYLIEAQQKFYSQIQVVLENTDNKNLTVEVIGFGKNQILAENNAVKNLFMSLFFRGIPGSPAIKPLIGSNETEVLSKYDKYFNQFFEKSRYTSFINKLECSQLKKVNKQKRLVCTISINVQSLKDDLRINKLITDYGF